MQNPIPILLYHSIGQTSNQAYARWCVEPAMFADQIGFFLSRGYTPLTITELANLRRSGSLPALCFAVTFDDGLLDFLSDAFPVFTKFDVPVTLYVPTGHVGATASWLKPLGEGARPMMSWNELGSVAKRGVEIGAHTVGHPQLDILSSAAAAREIIASKQELEDRLGLAVSSFAYPHGYSNRAVRGCVEKAGFSSACRVRHALSSPTENIYALSRIIMTNEIGPAEIENLLAPLALPVAPPVDRLLGDGWRLVRKVQHHWGNRDARYQDMPT